MRVRQTTVIGVVRQFDCLGALLLMAWCSPLLQAAEFEGFTEPYRNIDVAAADSGIVDQLAVKEGDAVLKGQLLGQLNLDVLQATLEIADRTRNAMGKLKSAEAELRLKSERLAKLQLLLGRKHATQEEVDRTAVEKDVAEAQLLAVQEELVIRKLEYDRIQKQIDTRILRSPIDGVVTRVYKDQGEFVAPTDPVVMNVVQLDPLVCVFSIPVIAARELQEDAEVTLQISDAKQAVKGVIEFVSPVTDAQSGTVQLKVRLSNTERKYRSGDKCWLVLQGIPALEQKVAAPVEKSVPRSAQSTSATK